MKKKISIVLLLGLISISFTGCLSMIFPEPNNPPAITSSPIETATVEELYTYTVEATDPDGDVLTHSLTACPVGMTIDSTIGTITWAPNAIGSYEVTVEVSDGKSSDVQSFSITVSESPNQAPAITSTPITSVTLGETYIYTVIASDPDGDDLIYSLTDKPTGMTIDSTIGTITWTPTADGSFEVTVEVSDVELNDIQTFTITVSEPEPINQSPFITSIPVTAVILGETYTCTIEATDPDGDILIYSLAACPVGMTIDSTIGTISWTPTALGYFGVTVKVSDGELNDIRSFTITVSPVPVGPTIVSLSPLEAVVGELYTGQVNTTPGSNATLAYSLIGAPDGMTINSITGLINWIPAAAGEQTVTIVVINGIGLSDSKDYNIVVSPANQAPVITTIPDTAITLGETYTYIVIASDPDGDDLIYSLIDKPTGMTINPTTGGISWLPTAVGSYNVTVEVSDGELIDTQSFTITINPSPKRVVMLELFEGPECGRCKVMHSDIVRLRQEYGFDELVILEEYGWDTSQYTGWGINDVKSRYYGYLHYLGIDGHFPDAYFNGINQTVHYDDSGYNNYKAAIEAELATTAKIYITANYSISGRIVSINGNIANISSSTLNNLVVEAMVYENSVYSGYRKYNVDHVVRDIITNEESGESIISFSPGESHEFSLTSSYLSNVHDMSNIHVVVYVQAPNSSTKEILQALYVE